MYTSPNALYRAYAKFGMSVAKETIFSGGNDKEFRRIVEEELKKTQAVTLAKEDIQNISNMSDEDLYGLECIITLTKEGKRIVEIPPYIQKMLKEDIEWDEGTIEINDEDYGKREMKVKGIFLNGEPAF